VFLLLDIDKATTKHGENASSKSHPVTKDSDSSILTGNLLFQSAKNFTELLLIII